MIRSTAIRRLSDQPARGPSGVADQSFVFTSSDIPPSETRHPGGKLKDVWFIAVRRLSRIV